MLRFERLEQRQLLAVDSLTLDVVVDDFVSPVVSTHADDGSGRLFVAQQGGKIQIVQNGQRQPEPFLDISARLIGGGASGERGLLGLAFHPDYANPGSDGEGKFYVYYSASSATGDHDSVIAEYRVSGDNPNVADAASERIVLQFSQPFSNHNGGDLKFGPDDGLLYISSGDGGGSGDPNGNGQNGDTLLGAILRIDVAGDDFASDATRNYAVPPTNPFVNDNRVRDEIFALGLRNPFRMSFDDGPNGAASPDRLFVGDVGQNAFEEVDLVVRGGNYGWNVCEGDHRYQNASQPCPSEFQQPIAEYGRGEGNSVIGGFVYRGPSFPSLDGVYVFGDLSGSVMVLEEQGDGSFLRRTPTIEGDNASAIIGFGEDESGELYVLTFSQLLSISASTSAADVFASGEVQVRIEADEIVVANDDTEFFREAANALASLTITLSGGDDELMLPNLVGVLQGSITINGAGGDDTLRLVGSNQSLDLTNSSNPMLIDIEAIDLRGDGPNELSLTVAAIRDLSATTDTLRVFHDNDDTVSYGDGWRVEKPILNSEQLIHQLVQDEAIVEVTNSRPFQNPLHENDADHDGSVTAFDALLLINALPRRRGVLELPVVLDAPFVYFDATGNNELSALDPLQIINGLPFQSTAIGEGTHHVTDPFIPQRIETDEIVKKNALDDGEAITRSNEVQLF